MDELKGLKDIKDVVEVSTFNPVWLFIFLLLIAILIFIYFKFFKRAKKKKFKLTPKEIAKNNIKSINWDDAKSIAYRFSQDVALFIDESNANEYKKILNKLDEYKYKKEVPKMDSNLKNEIKRFIKALKWQD
jgi:Mg/Co/Ni transporter MgtE